MPLMQKKRSKSYRERLRYVMMMRRRVKSDREALVIVVDAVIIGDAFYNIWHTCALRGYFGGF